MSPLFRVAPLTNGIVTSSILLGGLNWGAAQSQPVADDTLGNDRSAIVPLGADTSGDRIDGGARRSDNLFHSLQQLNVDTGRNVYFSDPGVNNIITRVTGGTSSQIDGLLGVLGNANLFLINPSGIIFGANASLDIGGSFTATTADAIGFNNQGNFSATNPTAPPLLTVQPSAFLFNQLNPAPSANNSIAAPQRNPSGAPGFGLRVPEGKGLTLLGGNISMNGGGVNALGGQVEIGGLSAPGTVSRNADGSLKFPTGIARADVSLTNRSFIDVAANGSGTIAVNASKFKLTNEVRLQASTFGKGNAGDVIIDALDRVAFDKSYIFSTVGYINSDATAVGNGGDIRITTGSLSLTNGAQMSASTLRKGDAGNVIINARDRILIDGVSPTRPSASSAIFSSNGAISNANQLVVGNGGDIHITTGSLFLTNGAQMSARTLGEGNAGNVIINARDRVLIDGVNSSRPNLPSAILSSNGASNNANQFAVGNGGDIRITTGSLFLTNGAGLQASTLGRGNAGNVIINARDRISLDGASDIYSSVGVVDANTLAVGNGGDIRITTGSLALTNRAALIAFTVGQGNAGNVIINARDRISLDDSGILSSVGVDDANILAVGNGGDIRITTGSLFLTSGAQLQQFLIEQGTVKEKI